MYAIEYREELHSTNALAKEHLENLPHLQVISADIQTKGHGQFERTWYSSNKNGGNCYISIILKPKNTDNIDKITRYTSLKVAQTLEKYGLKPTFKYPNDVLVNGKKIAGILAESVMIGQILKGIVVGVGVNLNLEAEEVLNIDQEATSIFIETSKNVSKKEFIENFMELFEQDLCNLDKYEGEILCYQNK
ncbi:MAG: biotin--[acetyl-CoA-carboxylase] ligase [Cyanobacteria bacterium SIG30]|nr:biotin--[acetyl-CoA-carboxylase] ligase [Cyanobacteria bacterium SIG30]